MVIRIIFKVITGKFFFLSKNSPQDYLSLTDDFYIILTRWALSEMRIINQKEPWYFGFNFGGGVEKRGEEMLSEVKFYTRLGREERQARKVILNLLWKQMTTLFSKKIILKVEKRRKNIKWELNLQLDEDRARGHLVTFNEFKFRPKQVIEWPCW